MNNLKTELQRLYADASKHSVYQNIPDFVSRELGYTENIDESWRGDRPRLAWLIASRSPVPGEHWLDFGANTGFFTLSLAHGFPQTRFTAVEANPNHAHFIERVAQYFGMTNIEVIQHAVGLSDLHQLPLSDCLLHLNVLHHAGHDFDAALVPDRTRFAAYAQRYLELLRERTHNMCFQVGSNWGGDKQQPLVAMREDIEKLSMLSNWLHSAGWRTTAIAYAAHAPNGKIHYEDLPANISQTISTNGAPSRSALQHLFGQLKLDSFPGEFYRRPLFLCRA